MNSGTILIVALVLVIALIALGREVICWYFKIHQRLDLLEEISEKLTIIINQKHP
jgi:hypothetical protein